MNAPEGQMKLVAKSTVAICTLAMGGHALAADYSSLRPSYPDQWETSEDNPLRFDMGVRYWYSLGRQEHSIGAFSETMDTKTHSGEAFVRIDDLSTRSYLEATGGYGIAHEGTYATNGGASATLPAARLGYVGADFGWLPLGTDQASFGFVTGYQYTNDSPDTGRANFTTVKTSADINWSDATGIWNVGADSEINNFDVHALKVGIAGKLDFDAFDITGEAAVTPYAWVNGTYGAAQLSNNGPFGGGPGGITSVQGSAASINGHAYGASGKVMVGFHPTENFTIRFGGRASYLQGQYDVTHDRATITAPVPNPDAPPNYLAPALSQQGIISNNNPFSMLRYGALFELAGRF
jgi:hypothetical protein